MDNLYQTLIQAVVSFLVLFIISKLLGKKQVAQLEFIDYAVGISIGSIAAQMAVEQEIPYYHFILAMAIYALLDFIATIIGRKSRILKKFFKGAPLIIINQGEINYNALKKSKLDINEVVSICRIKGFFSLSEISYCIFEANGDFSILPKAENLPTVKKDLNIKAKPGSIALHIVVDGKINKKSLKNSGEDLQWLFEKAKANNKKELNNILLLSYFKNENKVEVFYKS